MTKSSSETLQATDKEWITFPGGELEGKRPKVLCQACRQHLQQAARNGGDAASARRPLCFRCYRAELERVGALKAAGQLDTASDARFQCGLPFEPVNMSRLAVLKDERVAARAAASAGAGRFTDRRRQAQIAARHALQSIGAGLKIRLEADAPHGERSASGINTSGTSAAAREPAMAAAIHAAELQLPESWLPFVVSQ